MPGPRKNAAPSMVVAVALAAVSCSGVRASVGRSAAWAGRKTLVRTAATPASAHRPASPTPSDTATAIATAIAADVRLLAIITRVRR